MPPQLGPRQLICDIEACLDAFRATNRPEVTLPKTWQGFPVRHFFVSLHISCATAGA